MTLELIFLRACQAGLFIMFLLSAPTFMALLIRWGGTALRQAMGW